MDIVGEAIKEMEKRGQEKLSDHLYGLAHPLIGKPCLYKDFNGELHPALPYGAYRLSEESEIHVQEYKRGKPLLVVAYFDNKSPVEGIDVHVKATSAVSPDDLIPVEPNSKLAQKISHTVLSWLVDNRSGTFRDSQKKRELEKAVSN